MTKKITVGILFGGKSAEHEISILSAKNILLALDKSKYNPILIAIDPQGRWFINDHKMLASTKPRLAKFTGNDVVTVIPHGRGKIQHVKTEDTTTLDVVFPILHGTYGEDGTVQGLLKLADVPFVGAGVLGSAVGMDKDVMKRLFRDANIPSCKFLSLRYSDRINNKEIINKIGLPLFVKPANLGSSVGISKVKKASELSKAIQEAFQYDTKIIIEEFIPGREIECSVLGNNDPIVSLPGEIIPTHEFYSYEAKYVDPYGANFKIPAKLSKKIIKRIQELAIKAYKTSNCEGLARVDFFLPKNGHPIVNEINTMPGFTAISMYPKMWEASGLNCTDLIDKLIALAIERFEKEQSLKTHYDKAV